MAEIVCCFWGCPPTRGLTAKQWKGRGSVGPGEQAWPWDLTRSSWDPLGHHTDPAQSPEPSQNQSTNTSEGPHFPQESLVLMYWTSLNMQFTEMGIYFGIERLPVLHCINILIKPDWEDSCTIYQDGRCVSGKTSTGNIFMKNGLRCSRVLYTDLLVCCLMLCKWTAVTLWSQKRNQEPLTLSKHKHTTIQQ